MLAVSFIAPVAMIASVANGSTNAQPANNPGTWVTSSDYPPAELVLGTKGRTTFNLKIGTDGMVKSCVITKSSGSSVLDQAACQNVTRRARFHPAKDEKGRPTEGSWTNSVRWNIPGSHSIFSLPYESNTSHEMTLIVEKDGSVSSCKFDRAMSEDQKAMLCEKAQTQFGKLFTNGIVKERASIVVTTSTKMEIVSAEKSE